jgi:hypothetical protein
MGGQAVEAGGGCPARGQDTSRAGLENRAQRSDKRFSGWVAEWFKALVLKTSDVKASVGSNPTPSANNRNHLAIGRRARGQRHPGRQTLTARGCAQGDERPPFNRYAAPLLCTAPFVLPDRQGNVGEVTADSG